MQEQDMNMKWTRYDKEVVRKLIGSCSLRVKKTKFPLSTFTLKHQHIKVGKKISRVSRNNRYFFKEH